MKRKSNTSECRSKRKSEVFTCILHTKDIQHGDFTLLSNVKGSAEEKLEQLHNIRERRLLEPRDSPNRMEAVCYQIPESVDVDDLNTVGYHRGCYQKFMKNLDRLKSKTESTKGQEPALRSPRSKATPTVLFPQECIFCQRLEVKVAGKTERCIKFREPTWKQIETRAIELGNYRLHRMVHGEDLFAREANFHNSCRKSFNLQYINHVRNTSRATNRLSTETEEHRKSAAYSEAFEIVIQYIDRTVVGQKEIIDLSFLLSLFQREIEKRGFPNPQYRGEKLKARIESHAIGDQVKFVNVKPSNEGCITYNLLYSASITVADAVAFAFQLASRNKVNDVAIILRSAIQRAFKESKSLPWPPLADDLDTEKQEEILPQDLLEFLSFVISGDVDKEICSKTKRFVLSIGQVRV